MSQAGDAEPTNNTRTHTLNQLNRTETHQIILTHPHHLDHKHTPARLNVKAKPDPVDIRTIRTDVRQPVPDRVDTATHPPHPATCRMDPLIVTTHTAFKQMRVRHRLFVARAFNRLYNFMISARSTHASRSSSLHKIPPPFF